LLKHLDDLNRIEAEDVTNFNPAVANEDMTIRDLLYFIKKQKFPVNYLPVVNHEGVFTGALTFENLIKGE
jgi:ribulose-phosphate 3-epimerase